MLLSCLLVRRGLDLTFFPVRNLLVVVLLEVNEQLELDLLSSNS